MANTYDPSQPNARDRIRYALFDKGTPAASPSVPFEITGALEPDITYDANLNLYTEDEVRWLMASAFLARYSTMPDAVGLDDGTRAAWRNRVHAWETIVANSYGYALQAQRGRQKPLVGQLKTTAPISPPEGYPVDANDPAFRGNAYPRGWY